MKYLWWRIITILLIFYALFAGMMVPLKPGITGLSQSLVSESGPLALQVNTYKMDLNELSKAQAYLKLNNEYFLEAKSITRNEGLGAILNFDIPGSLPTEAATKSTTVIITDPVNGTIVYPDGLLIRNHLDFNESKWQQGTIESLHKKTGFVFPYRNILLETIRNTFYHVTLWFAMFILFFAGTITSIQFLRTKNFDFDHKSFSLISAGILMGVLGLITGSLWAKDTWGTYWTSDVKLNMSAISMMIYLAYLILRSSIQDVDKKAKISSAYAIFAFVTIVPLIFVIPRMTDSLHPGNGGNPALGGEDMDNTMRMVFYPAIIGFTLVGVWISTIILRTRRLHEKLQMKQMYKN